MPDPKPLAYTDALEAVLSRCAPLLTEAVPFTGVLGRVLAEDARASRDDPPAAKSAMDGFALRAADTAAAGPAAALTFAYGEVVGAGHVATTEVPPAGAVRIMTGALLPTGADAVVKQEDTERLEGQRFAIRAPLAPGENVIARGAVLRQGDLLLGAGGVVSPQALGLLASQGAATWRVHRRPRVGLLALGDELVEPGRPLQTGQLYVSNLYALEALCSRYGAEPCRLGIVGDDPQRIEATVRAALAVGERPPCDVVLTLGGSHQGDFDYAHDVLTRLGAALHFRRTRINLGGSTLFATREQTLFFGLPGTPMASWLAFEVLVRPALWKLGGRAALERPRLQARLVAALRAQPGRTMFVPARVELSGEAEPRVQPLVRGSPLALPASVLANGLIHLPPGSAARPADAAVPVELLGEG